MLVLFYQNTPCHFPEDSSLPIHLHENFQTYSDETSGSLKPGSIFIGWSSINVWRNRELAYALSSILLLLLCWLCLLHSVRFFCVIDWWKRRDSQQVVVSTRFMEQLPRKGGGGAAHANKLFLYTRWRHHCFKKSTLWQVAFKSSVICHFVMSLHLQQGAPRGLIWLRLPPLFQARMLTWYFFLATLYSVLSFFIFCLFRSSFTSITFRWKYKPLIYSVIVSLRCSRFRGIYFFYLQGLID
jgi:hypothetical protein